MSRKSLISFDSNSDTRKTFGSDTHNDAMMLDLYEILHIGDIDSIIKWSKLFTSDILYRKYLQNFTFPLHISRWGDTMLHAACRFGHMDIVKLLIQWSSNDILYKEKRVEYLSILEFLTQKNALDETATDVAYNTEIIMLLEELESRLSSLCEYIMNDQKYSFIVQSILHSDSEQTIKLLKRDKQFLIDLFKIHDQERGFSIYHWICLLNLPSVLEYCFDVLQESFCSLVKKNSSTLQDYNLLHESIRFSSREAILYLLSKNINPYEKNSKGISPMDLASKRVKKLLKTQDYYPSPKSEKKKRGRPPKKNSESLNSGDLIKKKRGRPPLKSKTANQLHTTKLNPVTKEKSTGRSQLHRFASSGDLIHINQLLQLGADINAQDNSGHTALHVAELKGHLDVVKLLLRHGSNPNTCSTHGDTPMHDAITNGHDQVVRNLLESGSSDYHGELKPPKLAHKLKLKQDILIT